MSRTSRITGATLLLLVALGGNARPAATAEAAPNEDLIQMIVELVSDEDRDMRALGLQQIREEVPGEAATRKFVELLPKLPRDGQAELIEALGDRGDEAARQAVVDALQSDQETIRAAATKALGGLGTKDEVPLLAERAAAGSPVEKTAARQALIRLRSDEVNQAIVDAMEAADPAVRAALMEVAAARNATEALPGVLAGTGDTEASVRLAALNALRYLAAEERTAEVIDVLKAAQDETERAKAELALLGVCSRGRAACVDALVAGIESAEPASRIALVRALARAGGPKALEAVAARLEDDDEAVRDEAARMLSGWPDASVKSHLVEMAKGENLRHHVLAIRGLVRLADAKEDQAADVEALAEVMALAKRPEEKRLVAGALGSTRSAQAFDLVLPLLYESALVEEAALAAVMVAEKMDGNQDDVRAAMQRLLKFATRDDTRARANKVLESL